MDLDKDKAIALLNRIMELELAGVVRYTHYSLMVYGYSRIPVVEWMKAHPELNDSLPVDAMFRFLGERFPCRS